MPIEVKMPALSPTMENGTLAKWLVGVGYVVKVGDLLAEIETDKATMEFEAVDEGTITSLVIAEGTEDVAVGTVIATLTSEGETLAPTFSTSAPEPKAASARISPADIAAKLSTLTPTAPDTTAPIAGVSAFNASPLARCIADAQGISLAAIKGSGVQGRIVKADLALSPYPAAPKVADTAPASPHSPAISVPHSVIKLTGMRKTIARRLTESKQTVPHFYLSTHCNIDALLKLRGELNVSLVGRGIKLSVNDLLIKAMALAMQYEPSVNVQFAGDEMHLFDRVDISMAVAIDDGLITPIIRDINALTLSDIAEQSTQLAARARDGKLAPEEYQGGTASISNLGMFGIDEIFPVINPPQALILGIGSGIEKPWKVNGEIALATIMTATASFDHRAIDGATAARFMAVFRKLLENPMLIVC